MSEPPKTRITRTTRPQSAYRGGTPEHTGYTAYQRPPAQGPASFDLEDTRYQRPQAGAPGQKARAKKKTGAFSIWTLPVIIICAGLLLMMGWYVGQEYQGYKSFEEVRSVVQQSGFFPGIQVDGLSIAGMSLEAAQERFAEQNNQNAQEFAIKVTDGERNWRITAAELPLSFNANALLERAYSIGRSGNLQQRYSTINLLAQQGIEIRSEMTFDESRVDELVGVIAERLNIPVQNAALDAFDPVAKVFHFKDPQAGYAINEQKLRQDILTVLDNKNFNDPIQVSGQEVPPTGDASLVTQEYGLIASYTTETTKNENRNTNISLSAAALNGQMVMPGATFSFNGCTGERAPSKGYKEAGAISSGQLVDAFGGGVCQTSSTLFNAIVRANLPVVERSKHSWPSTYVPRGEDAAVDYPDLDFKFQNDQDTPIFLVAWYADRKVTVEVYGKKLPQGITIDLVSETMEVIEPSSQVIYTRKEDMASGTEKVAKEKRTGYLVDTYKVFFQDGVAQAKEKLWTTKYNAVQKEIYYN